MQLLKEIFDKPIGNDNITTREAARAVIFDEDEMIPMLFVSKYNYHKLPGGGIEIGENIHEALMREILEETGCTITVHEEVGKIVEYVSEWNWMQTSYCYLAKVVEKGHPEFTAKELEQGFQIQWMSLDDAITTIKNNTPEDHKGKTVQLRDIVFLEKAKELLNTKI